MLLHVQCVLICLLICFRLLSLCFLSGRLDSTNILPTDLSLITSIGLEHTQFLGNTVEEITREKAGIIREGVPVVVGKSVVHEITKEVTGDATCRCF
jgi:folylpolyglutamate synthase/dihydropteroate synthase